MALSADRPIRAEDVEAADEWYEEQVELAGSPAGVLPTPQNSLPGAGREPAATSAARDSAASSSTPAASNLPDDPFEAARNMSDAEALQSVKNSLGPWRSPQPSLVQLVWGMLARRMNGSMVMRNQKKAGRRRYGKKIDGTSLSQPRQSVTSQQSSGLTMERLLEIDLTKKSVVLINIDHGQLSQVLMNQSLNDNGIDPFSVQFSMFLVCSNLSKSTTPA